MKKLFWIRIKEYIIGKEKRYLTAKEKAEMIKNGENIPIYIDDSQGARLLYRIVPERRFIPGAKKRNKKNIKL